MDSALAIGLPPRSAAPRVKGWSPFDVTRQSGERRGAVGLAWEVCEELLCRGPPPLGWALLGLGDDLFDVAGGGGGGEGFGAEVVHDVQVVVQVGGRLQVEGAGEVLDV